MIWGIEDGQTLMVQKLQQGWEGMGNARRWEGERTIMILDFELPDRRWQCPFQGWKIG